MAITNVVGDEIARQEHCKRMEKPMAKSPNDSTIDPMLLTVSIGKKPVVVEMEIMGRKLTNTIVVEASV